MHRALCGSLFDDEVLRELLGGARAAALYCDPPWGPALLTQFGDAADVDQRGRWPAFVARFASIIATHVDPRGAVFVEIGDAWADEMSAAITGALGLEPSAIVRRRLFYRSGSQLKPSTLLVLERSGSIVTRARLDLLDYANLRGLALPREALRALDLPRESTVLDPCCGKGFTARACVLLGLAFRGLELVPYRWEVTQQWLQKRA